MESAGSHIQSATSDTRYSLATDGTIRFARVQKVLKSQEIFDAFPKVWGLAYANLPAGKASLRGEGRWISAQGRFALLTPPFHICHWKFHETFELPWSALVFRCDYPAQLPKVPTLIDMGGVPEPQNLSDVLKLIEDAKNSVSVQKCEDRNPYAIKLKRAIDSSYRDEISLALYARELAIHPEVLTRYFKTTFGMTPVDYRTQLRLFESIWDLVAQSPKVTDVAGAHGFSSLRNFYTLFKKYTSLRPGQLRLFGRKSQTPNKDNLLSGNL